MPEEFLDIVDETDNVIGRDTRENVHKSTSWHRGVHVLVFNGRGGMLLQRRGAGTDKYGNDYDLSASGHVESGETYEEAAEKELREELGIMGANPEKMAKIRMNYGDANDNMISVIYMTVHDGKVVPKTTDVTSVEFVPLSELERTVKDGKRPGNLASFAYEILKWYFHMPSRVEVIG